jgi:serine/threonine-protein kinase
LIETAIESLTRAGDAGSEPILGCAYLERSRLRLHSGDQQAARKDIGEAIARLRSPAYAPRLRQAREVAQKLGMTSG